MPASKETILLSQLEPVQVFRRLHKTADNNILDDCRIESQVEASIVEDITTLCRIGTAVAIFRIATQETEVFHRHKCLLVKLVTDFRTLGNDAQHLTARLGSSVQVRN